MEFNVLNRSIKRTVDNQPLVLAVDDNEDNLLLISYLLEDQLAYKLITATNSEEAIFKAKTYLPNLILLDIVLPEVNGLEIAKKLKQEKKTSNIPIIAVTGLAQQEDREEISRAGCDGYLCKPLYA